VPPFVMFITFCHVEFPTGIRKRNVSL
jgi:hypothetical protein